MLDRLAQATAAYNRDGGSDLLHAVTDLFLLEERPSETSKDHYAFIAAHALDRMTERDRAFYARWVASEPTLPPPVAKKLAADEQIAVAKLVLKLSPVLSDEDLATIALTHSQAHLIAIAERAALAEITTDVLASRGNLEVLRTLSGNAGARFSDRGLANLTDRGGHDPQVAANLADRQSVRQERQAQRLLRIAVQAEQEHSDPVRTARQRQHQLGTLLADLMKGRRALEDVVSLLCAEDRAFDLAVVLGTLIKLPATQILKALLAPDIRGIAVVCRSLGATDRSFREIAGLRMRRLKRDQIQTERDLRIFAECSDEVAERTLTTLRERFSDTRSDMGAGAPGLPPMRANGAAALAS
jgi:uncharacterized protein (DUF2336 family)